MYKGHIDRLGKKIKAVKKMKQEYKSVYKEDIKYHENMPPALEKFVTKVRLVKTNAPWTFDALVSDFKKLEQLGIKIDSVYINKNIPDDFGIEFSFDNSYKTAYANAGILIPLTHEGLEDYSKFVRTKPDEFNIFKGRNGKVYVRVWWD